MYLVATSLLVFIQWRSYSYRSQAGLYEAVVLYMMADNRGSLCIPHG